MHKPPKMDAITKNKRTMEAKIMYEDIKLAFGCPQQVPQLQLYSV